VGLTRDFFFFFLRNGLVGLEVEQCSFSSE